MEKLFYNFGCKPIGSFFLKPAQTFLILFLLSVLFFTSKTAYSQIGPGKALVTPPTGNFAIDGNLQANVPTPAGVGDWLPGGAGSGGNVLNANGTVVNPLITYHLTDLYSSNSDNNFAGGKKFNDDPNTWTWVSNPVGAKVDMNNALIHFAIDANGHKWIIIAADRKSDNGDAYIDFEFLQNTLTVNGATSGGFSSAGPDSGRTVNDFALTLKLTQGGSTAGFLVNRWRPVAGTTDFDYFDATSSLPAGATFAAVNPANGTPVSFGAFGNATYNKNTFVEAAVDLTALLQNFDPCLSVGIKTILIKTKVSASNSSTIVDFINPLQAVLALGAADAGVDQSQCGTSFSLSGTATPAPGSSVISTVWSVVGGAATIANGNTLTPTVTVTTSPATLRLTVTTTGGCVATNDVELTLTPGPSAPGVSVVNNCDGSSDLTANNYTGTLLWSSGATTASIHVTNAATYTVTQTNAAGCTSPAGSGASAPRATPAAPGVSVVNNCDGSSDLTATNYTGTLLWSTGATTASIHVTNAATYTVTQTNAAGCTSLAGSGASAPNANPVKPTVCFTQPKLCGPATGSLTVLSPLGDYEYSIDGQNFQPGVTFNNLAAGSNPAITVKSAFGCVSDPSDCDAADCSAPPAGKSGSNTATTVKPTVKTTNITEKQTTVRAYPNPFSDKVKFVVTATKSGTGTLEVFNMLGQKVKTVYQGVVPAGVNNFELNLPNQRQSNLVYKFTMGEKQVTGKLIQIKQ